MLSICFCQIECLWCAIKRSIVTFYDVIVSVYETQSKKRLQNGGLANLLHKVQINSNPSNRTTLYNDIVLSLSNVSFQFTYVKRDWSVVTVNLLCAKFILSMVIQNKTSKNKHSA